MMLWLSVNDIRRKSTGGVAVGFVPTCVPVHMSALQVSS